MEFAALLDLPVGQITGVLRLRILSSSHLQIRGDRFDSSYPIRVSTYVTFRTEVMSGPAALVGLQIPVTFTDNLESGVSQIGRAHITRHDASIIFQLESETIAHMIMFYASDSLAAELEVEFYPERVGDRLTADIELLEFRHDALAKRASVRNTSRSDGNLDRVRSGAPRDRGRIERSRCRASARVVS